MSDKTLTLSIVGLVAVAAVLYLTAFTFKGGHKGAVDTAPDLSTPTSIPVTLEPVRWLSCTEDEQIVISLGENGLPYAYCQKVVEE